MSEASGPSAGCNTSLDRQYAMNVALHDASCNSAASVERQGEVHKQYLAFAELFASALASPHEALRPRAWNRTLSF
jgi:hypothetical protein